MERFQVSVGEDDIGKYMAVYDNWDIDYDVPIVGKVAKKAIPGFQIYDRVYYETAKPKSDLKIRKESTPEADYNNALNNLRAQIDVVDNQVIELLGKRMKAADSIGHLKKQKNVAVLQSKRWNEILGKMILEGEEKNLSEEFILRLFKAIHQESINHQEKIFKQ